MGTTRDEIQEHYAQVASSVMASKDRLDSAEGEDCCHDERELYSTALAAKLPEGALAASRGCGNPLAQVEIAQGMSVLDLGCGGGIDCLIAAGQVGPRGTVYGLDMTDEMLALANKNKDAAKAGNVEFLKGFIEDIPLQDTSVDLVSSNCVINLSDDKPRVLSEAHRVLKPGGTFIVADIIALKPGFASASGEAAARILGCRAGVADEKSYRQMMQDAGFSDVVLSVYKTYSLERMREKASRKGLEAALRGYAQDELDCAFGGAFIQGRKPA